MRGYMFRNRWFALLFVGLVLAGATRIVGTGKGDGALDDAAEQIAAQRDVAERFTSGTQAEVADEDMDVAFTADEELIDSATGEDPTPVDEFAAQQPSAAIDESEVVIVSQGSGQTIEVSER